MIQRRLPAALEASPSLLLLLLCTCQTSTWQIHLPRHGLYVSLSSSPHSHPSIASGAPHTLASDVLPTACSALRVSTTDPQRRLGPILLALVYTAPAPRGLSRAPRAPIAGNVALCPACGNAHPCARNALRCIVHAKLVRAWVPPAKGGRHSRAGLSPLRRPSTRAKNSTMHTPLPDVE